MRRRTVSWFSCGAASAVASKLAIIGSPDPVIVAYCRVIEEDQDNMRFLKDCEKWFGQKILILGNEKYNCSIVEVFRKTRYLKGPGGARCTGELKKRVREEFEEPNDRQIFGYTVEEQYRVNRFIDANADVDMWPILIEKGLTKSDCLGMVERAEIRLPAMYKHFEHANCRGCIKGEAGYHNKVRIVDPEAFARNVMIEKELGRTICKINMGSVKEKYPDIYSKLGQPPIKNEKGNPTYWRPTLEELPPDAGNYEKESPIECGIFCMMAEDDINSFNS